MSLDDLIETLQAFRAQYPGAGTAFVNCAFDLDNPWYDRGEVQLGFSFEDDLDDDDEEATRVH